MLFLDEGQQVRDMDISDRIPAEYTPRMIPHALASFTRLRHGEVFSQKKTDGRISFWQHHIRMFRKDTVYPYTPEPLALFHFMLDGKADIWLHEIGPIPLWERLFGLFLIPPGFNQKVLLEPGDYLSCHIDFDTGRLEQLTHVFPEIREVLGAMKQEVPVASHFLQGLTDYRLLNHLDEIRQQDAASFDTPYFLESKLNDIIVQYLSQIRSGLGEDPICGRYRELVFNLKIYILSRLHSRLDLGLYARNYGVNERTLERRFLKCFRQTPKEFLRDNLLERARMQLPDPEQTIESIALGCGFRNRSSFSKAFKKKFGLSPSYFR